MKQALLQNLRALTRTPVFSLTIVLIIAIGIGANTAIFSVVRSVLLRPLPLHDPDRLVRLRENFGQGGGDETQLNLSPNTWQRWRETNEVFTDIAVATGSGVTLTADGAAAEHFSSAVVSANFFEVLGVQPILGRNFIPEEDQPGAPRSVIISYQFWQERLGGSTDALGRKLTLDGVPHTVVGVMPRHFRHPYRAEMWTPIALRIDPGVRTGHYLYAPARLKPGVSLEQARDSMRRHCEQFNVAHPSPDNPRGAWVMPLHGTFVQDQKPLLLALFGAALFVLLIAGANLASLFLARQVERATDSAVRLALGASRGRLIREGLLQTLVLTALGTVAGIVLALWLTGPIYALSPMASDSTGSAMREFDSSIRIDGQVLLVSVGVALLFGAGFGLLPALRGARQHEGLALKGQSRGATLDRGTRRMLGGLIVVEIAIAVVLLVATGLMMRSYQKQLAETWGFATENRLSFTVSFSERLRPDHSARVAYVRQSLEALRALPGVVSANATTPDLVAYGRNLAAVSPQGSTPPQPRGYYLINHRMAMPGYFHDAGIRLQRGREIAETDLPDSPKVAVVSESFAKRFWPGQDAIGKTIKRGRIDDARPPFTVVGVFADLKGTTDSTDGDLPGTWYVAYAQNATFNVNDVVFVVHSQQDPASLQPAIRAALAKIDSSIATTDYATIEQLMDDTHVEGRFGLLIIGLFGVLGLLLAAIGLYGLLAFQVARRTREIGVRTALGARAADIVGMIMREGFALVLVGLAVGFAAAFALTRVMQSELHGVSATDPLSYLLAAAVLSVAAAFACWLPARRAAKVDPMIALRAE